MSRTREETINLIDSYKRVINNPATDRQGIIDAHQAIQILEHELARSNGSSFGDTQVPIIRSHADFEELKRKAMQGDAALQCAVGDICCDHNRPECYDLAEAAKWYEKAAEQDHPRALWLFGVSCAMGMGVEKNPKKAEQLLLQSAQSGDPDGQYSLGGFYSMLSDLVKAEYWLEKAVEQGHAEAKKMLDGIKMLLSI